MPSNFKIFISYRRKGGYDTAKLVYDRLRLDGYSVSFDIDTLRSGNFDKELERRIKKCKDFILILSTSIFDRLSRKGYNEKEDWVRQEISCALKAGKNIIPLYQDGFCYPDPMPEDIYEISRKNSLKVSPQQFEANYEKMKKTFLLSKPRWTVRNKKNIKKFFVITVLAFAVYLSIMAYSYHKKEVDIIKATAEQDLARVIDSMKSIIDSIRFANKLEKIRLADSINRAALNSAKEPQAVSASSAAKKVAPAATAKTTQKTTKKTQRGTR